MPPCIEGDKCQCPTAELEKRHFCAICKEELHGPCGIFNGDDSAITYRNRCSYCSVDGSEASGVNNDLSTQQSALISSKDVDPRKVSWTDIIGGDRPSTKAGETGQMVKSVASICGIDAMLFSTEQLCLICSSFKLSGYHSKPKAELLRIIGVGKIHQELYESSEKQNNMADAKAPAKMKNCMFQLINILFSDVMSPKFVQLGEKKDKNILDSGLAANDEYFWYEVVEQYQQTNVCYDHITFTDPMFSGIDPSIKLEHSWSKLRV